MEREALQTKLTELQRELEAGQSTLAELDRRRAEVRETLLRITGAIQVLEDLLSDADR